VGSAVVEAFEAAADAAQFGELHGLAPWRASKLYHSMGRDWQPGEESSAGLRRPELERAGFVRIDAGELDPVAGSTYQEQAFLAQNAHQTQALGFVPERGSFFYYYRLVKSLVPVDGEHSSFYDGLDPTLIGLCEHPGGGPPDLRERLASVVASVDGAMARFRANAPSSAAEPLLEGLTHLRALE